MGSPERPSKQEAFLALLKEGWTSLHLDARRAGVMVPPHLKQEAHLVLQYGNDLPIPIPDLVIDDNGVSATLSFARSPHHTVIPWSAVYVVASDDGRGVLYHEDIPRDVSVIASRNDGDSSPAAASMAAAAATLGGDGAVGTPPGGGNAAPRALRAVPASVDGDDAGAGDLSPDLAEAPRRRRRPQLRLVK